MKIEKVIYDLNKDLQNKVVNIVNEVLEEALQELKDTAPVDTGYYKESMKIKEAVKRGNIIKGKVYNDNIVATTSGKEYVLGELLEHGTAPHMIYPVNSPRLHFQINGKEIYAKKVSHPGTIPQPHWQPVYEKSKIKLERMLKNI